MKVVGKDYNEPGYYDVRKEKQLLFLLFPGQDEDDSKKIAVANTFDYEDFFNIPTKVLIRKKLQNARNCVKTYLLAVPVISFLTAN
ncbi:hypothetical protein Cni_G09187 [Canna indica]|uniref:Uncharacterized protein n=1 Tax=Canna indica TaxID=4628 RepID=A0AAQ3K1U2_9LILI|nr:hypothetical protein Cni_G09187 [Canna indica]